jgi:2-iminobutanoate/2-iminopropanoate deaminase
VIITCQEWQILTLEEKVWMDRQIISPVALPVANPTYSQAVRSAGLIFVAGQIGMSPATGKLVSDEIAEQTRQALENTRVILEAAGSSLEKVVLSNLFLTDFRQLQRVNAVYAEYFPKDGPAKMACGVTELYGGARFEIQVIAVA